MFDGLEAADGASELMSDLGVLHRDVEDPSSAAGLHGASGEEPAMPISTPEKTVCVRTSPSQTATEGRPKLMEWVGRGRAMVQDPSSQMVARIAVSAVEGRGRAVDLCAAPGGKTALMRKLGRWDFLVAADVSPAKAA